MSDEARWGDMLEAISHPYRRELLVALLIENPQDDFDVDPLDVHDADDRDLLELELVHNHLPKLEEQGFIAWDRETNELSKGPNWTDIAPLIELIHNHREELPSGWL